MTTYRVADNHNVALGSLVVVAPQPASEGIKPTRRAYSASGEVSDEGKYVELVFNVIGSKAEYQSILTQFGVLSALTNEVTVYVRNEVFDWLRMNGTAVRPEPGRDVRWQMPFPRNVTILIKDLETAV